jgi:hypothetical protein
LGIRAFTDRRTAFSLMNRERSRTDLGGVGEVRYAVDLPRVVGSFPAPRGTSPRQRRSEAKPLRRGRSAQTKEMVT